MFFAPPLWQRADVAPYDRAHALVAAWVTRALKGAWSPDAVDADLFLDAGYNQRLYECGELRSAWGDALPSSYGSLREQVVTMREKVENLASRFWLEDQDLYAGLRQDTVFDLLIIAVRSGDEILADKLFRAGGAAWLDPRSFDDQWYHRRSFTDVFERLSEDFVGTCARTWIDRGYCAPENVRARLAGLFRDLNEDEQHEILHVFAGFEGWQKNETLKHLRDIALSNIALPEELAGFHEDRLRLLVDETNHSKRQIFDGAVTSILLVLHGRETTSPRCQQEVIVEAVHDIVCALYDVPRPQVVFASEKWGTTQQSMQEFEEDFGIRKYVHSIYPVYEPWTREMFKEFILGCAHEMGHVVEKHIARAEPQFQHLRRSGILLRVNQSHVTHIIGQWVKAREESTGTKVERRGLSEADPVFYRKAPHEHHAEDFAYMFMEAYTEAAHKIIDILEAMPCRSRAAMLPPNVHPALL